jgi:hypothetical protein
LREAEIHTDEELSDLADEPVIQEASIEEDE